MVDLSHMVVLFSLLGDGLSMAIKCNSAQYNERESAGNLLKRVLLIKKTTRGKKQSCFCRNMREAV